MMDFKCTNCGSEMEVEGGKLTCPSCGMIAQFAVHWKDGSEFLRTTSLEELEWAKGMVRAMEKWGRFMGMGVRECVSMVRLLKMQSRRQRRLYMHGGSRECR